MVAFPVYHPLVPSERPPATPGCCSTADTYAVGGVGHWHWGGEGESGIGFNAVQKLADLIVNKQD